MASPTVDTALVERLIAAQFPAWAGLPVAAIEPGGWDNRSFRLGGEMLVRLPSAAAYADQVAKEQAWLPRLAPQLPLPIPEPLAQGEPAEGYPWPWSVYRWLPGEPVTYGTIGDATEFARSLAGFLTALHRAAADGAPPPGQHNFHRGGRLAIYDHEVQDALETLGTRVDASTACDVWSAAVSSEWHSPPVWVHGDMAPGNLLVRDGALSGVIDFGCCAAGDPACDLVMAWTFFSGESRAAFRSALPLGAQTWARARGWALWKALITVSGHDGNQAGADSAWLALDAVLGDRATLG